jgi:hypothetical protein
MSRNQRRKKRNKPGTSQHAQRNANRDNAKGPSERVVHQRSSTETKSSLRTTEFIAYAGAVLAVVITALAVDADGRGGNDPFGTESALRCITYLTLGYVLARGLAKSGSRENRTEHATDVDGPPGTGVVLDDDHDDERVDDRVDERVDDDQRVGDDVRAAVVPSDRVQRPPAENVDVRP